MNGVTSLLPFVVVIGLMWLLLIRPQQNRQRQARNMLAQIAPGDRVMTHGGLFGQVVRFEGDDRVVLETSPGVTSTWLKGAISKIVQDEPDAAGSDVDLTESNPSDPDRGERPEI